MHQGVHDKHHPDKALRCQDEGLLHHAGCICQRSAAILLIKTSYSMLVKPCTAKLKWPCIRVCVCVSLFLLLKAFTCQAEVLHQVGCHPCR